MNTSVYLLNRLPIKAVKGMTPFEGCFGFKTSMLHLNIFGCLCYTFIPAFKRNKLEIRAQPVFESRDVKFSEETLWNWEATEAEMVGQSQIELNVGTMPISKVYERCNVVVLEPVSNKDATKENGWIKAMETKIAMIKKNET
ncbi:Integrase, catalytic core [Gossypium australe]|uniref:Integrase, catalytic core n=1 Tax=Gossypium australe TaxID=47621 RepID=A0A5B6VU61_9ROSI|nr:Integrase, catalytic core [Gossypium australe]